MEKSAFFIFVLKWKYKITSRSQFFQGMQTHFVHLELIATKDGVTQCMNIKVFIDLC